MHYLPEEKEKYLKDKRKFLQKKILKKFV